MGLCPFLTHYPQLSSNFHFLGQYFLTSPAYSVDINVSLHDFLRGNHGLWQRNPLGPYLFRLAIRIVSHNLNKAAEDGIISYHPKMQGLKTYTFVLLIIYLFSHMAPSLPWCYLSTLWISDAFRPCHQHSEILLLPSWSFSRGDRLIVSSSGISQVSSPWNIISCLSH